MRMTALAVQAKVGGCLKMARARGQALACSVDMFTGNWPKCRVRSMMWRVKSVLRSSMTPVLMPASSLPTWIQ